MHRRKSDPDHGRPEPAHIGTSYVERSNLSIRMGNRRFTRLTNASSKKIDNHIHIHIHMLSLYFLRYNFCRIHKMLRVTPAMQAGLSDTVRDMDWIVGMIDAVVPKPNRPAQYKLAKGTTDTLNTSITPEMADNRKPRG